MIFNMIAQGGGSGGLEYEEGTWSPTEDIARGSIQFTGTHTVPPAYVAIADSTGTAITTANTNIGCAIIDFYRLAGTNPDSGSSTPRYGLASYMYRGNTATNTSQAATAITHSSDETGASSVSYSRYWASPTTFYPSSNNSARYWKAGRVYKWIAIWI